MYMKKVLIPLFASLVLMSACKDDDHHHDDYHVDVVIAQPTEATEFNTGDMIQLRVNFSTDATIHDIEVVIENETTGEEVYHFDQPDHQPLLYELIDSVALTVTDTTNFVLSASTWSHDTEDSPIIEERMFLVLP